MEPQEFTVATPADFAAVIELVVRQVRSGPDGVRVITLTGDLGAGKTTFTQQLATYLGVTEVVTSPTFGIMKVYELPGVVAADREQSAGPGGQNPSGFARLVHIDAYRLEDESEALPLRLQEYFADPQNLVVLEWPEQIVGIVPEQRVEVVIEIREGEERVVTVSP